MGSSLFLIIQNPLILGELKKCIREGFIVIILKIKNILIIIILLPVPTNSFRNKVEHFSFFPSSPKALLSAANSQTKPKYFFWADVPK